MREFLQELGHLRLAGFDMQEQKVMIAMSCHLECYRVETMFDCL